MAIALEAARTDPANGLAYTFPVQTIDTEPGSQVRLLLGRSGNDPSGPSTTGDDVILADEFLVATAITDSDGRAEFPGLSIRLPDESVTSGTSVVPDEFLCGLTVVAVRSYELGDQASKFLASRFITLVSSCTPEDTERQ